MILCRAAAEYPELANEIHNFPPNFGGSMGTSKWREFAGRSGDVSHAIPDLFQGSVSSVGTSSPWDMLTAIKKVFDGPYWVSPTYGTAWKISNHQFGYLYRIFSLPSASIVGGRKYPSARVRISSGVMATLRGGALTRRGKKYRRKLPKAATAFESAPKFLAALRHESRPLRGEGQPINKRRFEEKYWTFFSASCSGSSGVLHQLKCPRKSNLAGHTANLTFSAAAGTVLSEN